MGIRVVKTPNFKRISDDLKKQRREILQREMLYAKTEIVGRTNQGRDVDDSTFEPYSDDYARWRKQRGYQVDPPNLTITGNMLQAIDSRIEERPGSLTGILLFAAQREAVKARSVNKLREFFALSKDRIEKILRALNGRS